MTQYTVSLSMDSTTRQYLQNKGYSLYVFKGVDAGKGAQSTVWVSVTGDALYNQSKIDISWQENLYIGETTSQLQNGVVVSGTNPFVTSDNIQPVSLGNNYIYEGVQWNPNPTQSGQPSAFTIENSPSIVNNFYVSQKVDTDPDYIVVQSITGAGGSASFIPIETISMVLSTQSINKGTIITQAFSPGLIITLVGITSTNISYDTNKGWNGPSGSTSPLKKGDSIYDSMISSYRPTLKSYANSVLRTLNAIESERGILIDSGFTATLVFGTLTVATWAYNHQALIASAANVVISSFSDLNTATRTFKVIGASAIACAAAMDAIVKAIKDNAPPQSVAADNELSAFVDVKYTNLVCKK
ncbi:hypothetical protein [Nostoc sp. PCC 7107]|uniref:hypothetical protein n=1 Tax=Nostoc sp. PCC 7107 TaxID=317936 RepID=UPI00029F2268|nr:hypothetical protein [Nostoc sp. PCC 7107]AFY41399.1 hypothetical protein Nos7107_0731 [Nostoc sp. PCC 7107]